jgi:hypothetical protein
MRYKCFIVAIYIKIATENFIEKYMDIPKNITNIGY